MTRYSQWHHGCLPSQKRNTLPFATPQHHHNRRIPISLCICFCVFFFRVSVFAEIPRTENCCELLKDLQKKTLIPCSSALHGRPVGVSTGLHAFQDAFSRLSPLQCMYTNSTLFSHTVVYDESNCHHIRTRCHTCHTCHRTPHGGPERLPRETTRPSDLDFPTFTWNKTQASNDVAV